MHRRLFAFSFSLLIVCTLVRAQAPPVPGNPRQVPATPGAAAGETVQLQFPNAPVQDVLSLYERLTGKRLVPDNSVQGPLNIVISQRVPKDEAIKIIETALLLNNFSLIPGENNIVKVIGVGKNPRTTGVPLYSDLDQIPEGERVVTFVFKLQFVDPQEMAQILQGGQLIAPSLYTGIVALPKSQTLLVTENTAVLRNIAKVVREVDVPPAAVVSEFIQLERADAKDVIEKLEKIFEKPTGTGGATAGGGAPGPAIRQTVTTTEIPPVPNAPPAAPSVTIEGPTTTIGTLSEESIIIGKIKLTADIRTNRIHVITRPINLPFVHRLIKEFDSNIRFGQPAKRLLKYISASDVLDVVVKSITEPGAKAEEGGGAAGAGGRQAPNTGGNQPGFSPTLGTSGDSGGGGTLNVSEGLSTQPVDTTPKAVTIGSTKIIADPRENAIIVLGNAEVRQKIFTLLDQLDVRAPQVMLNTVIGELRLRDQKDIGFNYFLRDKSLGSTSVSGSGTGTSSGGIVNNSGVPAVDLNSVLAGLTRRENMLDTLRVFTGGATGLQGIVAVRDLGALVNALETTGRFRVMQRPMIFTSNNKKAIIASGQEIAVPTQTLSNVANGINNNTAAVSSSIQFKTVALQLEVVPLINSDREVALDILQKVDDVSGFTPIGGNNVPNITTRYIRTNVSVPNGATVVLGGLIRSQTDNSDGGVPLMSRVPVIGYLFKSKSKIKERRELIILMRPVVTATPFETVDNSKTERQRLVVEPDIEAALALPAATPNPVNFRYHEFKPLK